LINNYNGMNRVYVNRAVDDGYLIPSGLIMQYESNREKVTTMLSSAQEIELAEGNVTVVSDDKIVLSLSSASKINSLTIGDFLLLLQGAEYMGPNDFEKREWSRSAGKGWQTLFFFTIFVCGGIYSYAQNHPSYAKDLLNSLYGLPLLLILAAAIFWFRGRHRVLYGVFEVIVGLLGAVPVFAGKVDNLLVTFASIYVMIRGLDNIGIGLRKQSVKQFWNWLFASR